MTLLSIMITTSGCAAFPGQEGDPTSTNTNTSTSTGTSSSTSSSIIVQAANTGTGTSVSTSTSSAAITNVATQTQTETATATDDAGIPQVVVVTVVVSVNLQDGGTNVVVDPTAPASDPPDSGTPTIVEASSPIEAATIVPDASPDAGNDAGIIFAQTVPDAGTPDASPDADPPSVPEASSPPTLPLLTAVALNGVCCNPNGGALSDSCGEWATYEGAQTLSSGYCQTGLTCVVYGPGGTGVCKAPSQLGGICNTPDNDFCDVGLTCFGHPCRLGGNSNCIGDPVIGSTVIPSTCVVPGTYGSTCQVTSDCAINEPGACTTYGSDAGLICQFPLPPLF
jgi:hypothetical protein